MVTPHIAWISFEARKRIMQTTYENVVAALEGRAVNVVN
jgi:glycerate dehydrogenase